MSKTIIKKLKEECPNCGEYSSITFLCSDIFEDHYSKVEQCDKCGTQFELRYELILSEITVVNLEKI